MQNKFIIATFNLVLLGGIALTQGCANKKVAEEKNTDTSHNIFTGSNTVTSTDEAKYQNQKTGKVSEEKTTKKTKYDKNGKKVSTNKETESE